MTEPEGRCTPLGEYLRGKRVAAGLSQQTLAARIGFGQSAVAMWESGQRKAGGKAIAALARQLPGASADEMLALLNQECDQS